MLIVTGSLAYDYIMEFPGAFGDHILPEQIHNVNVSFIVNKYAKRRGGTAGNASYTLGLLKTSHVLFSSAGEDFGEYKKSLEELGVDTSHVHIVKDEYTATGFAMTDKSQNQIWGFYYGASEKNTELKLNTVLTPSDKENTLVIVGPAGADASMHMVDQCIELGIPYMFDPGFILTQVSDSNLEKGLMHAKYIIGNEYEMHLMQERIKNWNDITLNKTLITTLGEKGTLIASREISLVIPVVPVEKVASTTGAGDAWRGGFLAGLERGFDLEICGRMGSVAAAFAVEHFGTQEHNYTLSEFKDRYTKVFGEKLQI